MVSLNKPAVCKFQLINIPTAQKSIKRQQYDVDAPFTLAIPRNWSMQKQADIQ
jgi:hypothetical protein